MENYISIKEVLDNVLNHPLLSDVTLERAVHYAIDFMRLIGSPKLYLNKVDTVEIKDYRGMLPCDLCNIKQVRDKSCNGRGDSFRATTDTFLLSKDKRQGNQFDLTFKVQGGIIYTSIKEGEVEISYDSIATDEEGYPLIPDNSTFRKALELYIKKECFTILFDLGKISQAAFNNVQQEYAFAAASATGDLNTPSMSEMEALTGIWNNLVPRIKDFREGFAKAGTRENIKIH